MQRIKSSKMTQRERACVDNRYYALSSLLHMCDDSSAICVPPSYALMLLVLRGVLAFFFFFFQAEDGIRDYKVTGVQTCALPILLLQCGILAVILFAVVVLALKL